MKYLVVFEELENNYFAYIPDFPGCIATGKLKKKLKKISVVQ